MKKGFYHTIIHKIPKKELNALELQLIDNYKELNYQNSFDDAFATQTIKDIFLEDNTEWKDKEIEFLITFFVTKFLNRLPLEDQVVFTFEKRKKGEILAECKRREGSFELIYYPATFDDLRSKDGNRFLNGLRSVMHEPVHIFQGTFITKEAIKDYSLKNSYSLSTYLFAEGFLYEKFLKKEKMSEEDKKNYSMLFHENHAEKIAYEEAVKILKTYAKERYKIYSEEKIQKNIQKYEKQLEAYIQEDKDPEMGKFIYQMRILCSSYIAKYPSLLSEYPILNIAYFEDGRKKNILELLEQRKAMLKQGYDIEKMDALFSYLIEYDASTLEEWKKVKKVLPSYVRMYGVPDEFTKDILKNHFGSDSSKQMEIAEQVAEKIEKARKK